MGTPFAVIPSKHRSHPALHARRHINFHSNQTLKLTNNADFITVIQGTKKIISFTECDRKRRQRQYGGCDTVVTGIPRPIIRISPRGGTLESPDPSSPYANRLMAKRNHGI